jgi:hypothetical protein
MTVSEFLTRAWKLANDKARELGASASESDENEASVVNARTSVVSITCDLPNKLAIRLEDLFVRASEVNAVGKISQRLVAHPARSRSFVLP